MDVMAVLGITVGGWMDVMRWMDVMVVLKIVGGWMDVMAVLRITLGGWMVNEMDGYNGRFKNCWWMVKKVDG